LLAVDEDIERVADALLSIVPKERKKDEAVVFMGHGTHHPANAYYAALMYKVQLKDSNEFIGAVEGFPKIDHIRDQLLSRKFKKAYLIPFMSVAGDHAINDLAGDEEDSWKSILTKEGIQCVPVLKGTAEYDVFVDIWVDHLGGPLSHF
jgi:sirohydrochlorin cobaltochelatase